MCSFPNAILVSLVWINTETVIEEAKFPSKTDSEISLYI